MALRALVALVPVALVDLPPDARAALRADLLPVAIGVAVLVAALVAGALALARRGTGDRTLVYFSLVAGAYGLRLLISTTAARAVFGLPAALRRYLTADLTYLLLVPAGLFFMEMLGRGWQSLLARWWQISLLFAVSAIAYETSRRSPGAAGWINSLLVLAGMAVLVAHLALPRRTPIPELRRLRSVVLVFVLFVIAENLRGLGVLPWWPERLEPVGFLVLIGGLGSIVARRFFDSQASLAAMARDLETARRIQTSILPRRLPALAGLDLAVRYQPAAMVAGDFYDFLGAPAAAAPAGRRALGVLLADVSGHGVPAALIASMVKVATAAQAAHAAHPSRVLTEMNLIFHGQLERHFVTAVYLYLDLEAPGGARLTYSRAGHPPPLLFRRAGGAVTELREGGTVLGRLSRSEYGEAAVALAPGDTVVLYTDGIPEARDGAGEPFGEARLRDFLAAHGELPAESLAATLLEEIGRWSGRGGGAFEDDLTLLVLKIEGLATP